MNMFMDPAEVLHNVVVQQIISIRCSHKNKQKPPVCLLPYFNSSWTMKVLSTRLSLWTLWTQNFVHPI